MTGTGTSVPARAVWQISAGPVSRSYADVFLKHDVALSGPGDAGPWTPEREDGEFEGGFVRRFAAEVAPGDVVLLRTGIAAIAAVGMVASEYLYVNAFDDVNGWDLQHARRVRWYRLPGEHLFSSAVFGANPPRCSRVWNEEILDFAGRFLKSPPTHWQMAHCPSCRPRSPCSARCPASWRRWSPRPPTSCRSSRIGRPSARLPSEDELIAHFVVPFLRAHNWPPERIAVQWRRIDVAVFRALPRTPENCHLVIEAKRLGAAVEGAIEQTKGYVVALGMLRDVIVTDGIRYRMYAGGREFEPVAYANLARLKRPAAALFARMQRP